ncbi:MAG: tetratricopeptide repeat protein [Pyrinomonadaceae bacterium]|nr:tetratricopeptide repeat protein [Pyrinomonadaceae bacterium]
MTGSRLELICPLLFLSLLLSTTAFAQSQPTAASNPSPAAQAANALYQAQRWDEAVKAYDTLTKTDPNNGQAWFRLGSSLMSLNKYEPAIAPLERAAAILQGPMAYYTVGSLYAKLNNQEKAFEWLNKAAGAGFGGLARLRNDPNLAGVRDDTRYKTVEAAVERVARPCKYSTEARQLDFWVGEWDAQVNGQSVGTNVIERVEEGCLIMENWAGNGGATGKSMNFYNPVLKKWRQTYMSNNQIIWEMSGEYKDGIMRYDGEMISAGSQPIMVRVKFYNQAPERVRHTQENSTDGGRAWTNVWDATYVRKKTTAASTTR